MSFINPKINLLVRRKSDAESIRKGIAIFGKKRPLITLKNDTEIVFDVQSDSDKSVFYTTIIQNYLTPAKIRTSCSCPYDWGGFCKHKVAALLMVDELLSNEGVPAKGKPKEAAVLHDQMSTSINFTKMEDWKILQCCDKEVWKQAADLIKNNRIQLLENNKDMISLKVKVATKFYFVRFEKFSNTYVKTSSDFEDTKNLLCAPKVAALRYLAQNYGENVFDDARDFTEEKNKLLKPYGFTTEDDLKNRFDFKIKMGKIELVVLDHSISKADDLAIKVNVEPQKRNYVIPELATLNIATANKKTYDTYIFVLSFVSNHYFGFIIKRIKAQGKRI